MNFRAHCPSTPSHDPEPGSNDVIHLPSVSCASVARPTFAASRQHLSVSAAVASEAQVVKAKAPKSPKKEKEAPKEDTRIKRAPSALNLYVKAAMPALKAKSGTASKLSLGELVAQWKDLAPEVKAPFEAESKALKEVVALKR